MKAQAVGKQVSLITSGIASGLTLNKLAKTALALAFAATALVSTRASADFTADGSAAESLDEQAYVAEMWNSQDASQAGLPTCFDTKGGVLDVNNDQVVDWKHHSQNQFRARGHIKGVITNIFPDATGHHHIEVTIGQNSDDTVEVIYNEDFGALPEISLNHTLEACGDYITSNARSGGYPASPDGAILHWVHLSTNNHHPSGYVAIDGVAYGIGKQKHVPPRKKKH